MAHTDGGGAKVKYGSAFFHWFYDQILMVEDYTYDVTEFRGGPDIPLPVGAQWGDIGKNTTQEFDYFFIFMFYNFY